MNTSDEQRERHFNLLMFNLSSTDREAIYEHFRAEREALIEKAVRDGKNEVIETLKPYIDKLEKIETAEQAEREGKAFAEVLNKFYGRDQASLNKSGGSDES